MSLSVVLRCNDLAETKRFYEAVLGFNVSDSANGTLTVQRDGACLIFTAEDLWRAPAGCTGTFYFAVADATGYYQEVAPQASVAWPLEPMSYGGQEFGINDCNGYTLAFRQQV
ncbi:VOC family protein [Stenotrophomonas acidaminiphila]|uniref:VOC family protein n=1 Tax=Stenotrophomonas acidaminiphila TaxID=128780 RepID=UPI0020C663C1|nr:VOC family protein [Stenotrophomonas acidaminiphila]